MTLKVAKVANFWGYGIGDLGRFATTKTAKVANFRGYASGDLGFV
jgi:hypothetical protein